MNAIPHGFAYCFAFCIHVTSALLPALRSNLAEQESKVLELKPTGAVVQDGLMKTEPIDPTTGCRHTLAGVDDWAIHEALSHSSIRTTQNPSGELLRLRERSYYIVACLKNSEAIMPHWIAEMLRFVLALRTHSASGNVTNLFVSVYESGSNDLTRLYLEDLKGHLNFLGVPHSIVLGGTVRGTRNRIDFLSDARNRAMEPLRRGTKSFDQVLWLNDVMFCADGALQMAYFALPISAGGAGADAVCGLDFYLVKGRCDFYDRWAARDMDGKPVSHRYSLGWHPYQAFSCWNGMVTFAADIFQVHRLSFRRNRPEQQECPAGEAELLMRDMWKAGRGKILVSPRSATAYDAESFEECAVKRLPASGFHHHNTPYFKGPPANVSCCGLRELADVVNWNDCYQEEWLTKNEQHHFQSVYSAGRRRAARRTD